jgi:Rrf2 family iron-sulfur cluster assembly transcriptional regulator
MDILRRNTDYALRAMIYLARHYEDGLVSARQVSERGDIPYQLTSKLLQKLHSAKLVESHMGPKGGFRLNRDLSKISLMEIIEAIQGKVNLSRCLLSNYVCPHQKNCNVRVKLAKLEISINSYLDSVTLAEIAGHKGRRGRGESNKGKK